MVLWTLALVAVSGAPVFPAVGTPETPALIHQGSLDAIYQARDHHPIWIAPDGGLEACAGSLIALLQQADQDGLRPADYHLVVISGLLENTDSGIPFLPVAVSTMIEPFLTDAFLSYGLDLSQGRVDPHLVYSRWDETRRQSDTLDTLVGMMITAPRNEEQPGFDPSFALDRVRPKNFGYQDLQAALSFYRLVARSGGWPTIPGDELLRPGDRNDRVALLRARINGMSAADWEFPSLRNPVLPWSWFAGFLPPAHPPAESGFYDDELAGSVRSFQERHGLVGDGLVGEKTLAALNESAHHKAARIALNLERIRWLPDEPNTLFVRVNIPSCRLDLMDQGRSILSMKTIVGRPDRPTPVMSDQLRWLEFNPYWNVPQKLVRKDILPKLLEDPEYLRDRDFHVFENWRRGAEEIDVDQIDWSTLNSWDIAFRFRQDPGPRNPLGRIKFLFPNRFSVYLHDTNHRGGFRGDGRYLSSGCVRLEDPQSLARVLAPEADLGAMLESPENKTIGLGQRVPIFLVYQTVWIDDSGAVNFAPDIYGYDARMKEILENEGKKILVSN